MFNSVGKQRLQSFPVEFVHSSSLPDHCDLNVNKEKKKNSAVALFLGRNYKMFAC